MNAKQIVLASRPKGLPKKENFRTEITELPELKKGEVLVKGLFYSVDPYMRGRMNDSKSYVEPFQIDAPIAGGVVAEIEKSNSDEFKKGDKITGLLPWATETVTSAKYLTKIDTHLAPPGYFLGILGMPGLTALFGLREIGKPRPGETVVISGAAGAVGIVAGQIAKIKNCRVVGIAGTSEKIELLKNEFHFDEAINYKTTADMKDAIKKACPNGVDVYFDNVGGEISDAVLANINFLGRIVVCGQIALYNSTENPIGPRPQPILIAKSVLMQGFIVGDFQSKFKEGIQQLSLWLKEGKIKYKETIITGFDKLPEAFSGLFSGRNTGKMLVKA